MNKYHIKFHKWIKHYSFQVQQVLNFKIPKLEKKPNILHKSVRYSSISKGKRIRAALLYLSGTSFVKYNFNQLLEIYLNNSAASLEVIHTYSLIHDDLPCMDNDIIRRGKPTVHINFNEYTAILTGNALQFISFELLLRIPFSFLSIISLYNIINSCNSNSMLGGQFIDLYNTNKKISIIRLNNMQRMKTGLLLESSINFVLSILKVNISIIKSLKCFSKSISLVFQIIDDILDYTSLTKKTGKTMGKDKIKKKSTYVSVLGINISQNLAKELHNISLESISLIINKNKNKIINLSDFILLRDH